MKSIRLRFTIVAGMVLGAFAVAWIAFDPSKRAGQGPALQSAAGPFELIEVTRRGEPFRQGSPLERFLDKVLPASGIAVGGLQLRKPEQFTQWDDAPLTLWLSYRGTNIPVRFTPPLFGARVLAENSAGRQIENPLPSVRRALSNELLISLPLVAFPRDEAQIIVRFSPPVEDESSRAWMTFKIANPFRTQAAKWAPGPLPGTNAMSDERLVLKEVSVDPVVCHFELPGAGWTVPQCSIEDAEGNRFEASSTSWNPNDPIHVSRGWTHTLETNHPWRIAATFVRSNNFAAGDLRTLRMAANRPGPTLTNRLGQVSQCVFNGLSIELFGQAGDGPPHWIITAGTNLDTGLPLKFLVDAQWAGITGGSILKTWPLEDQCSNIVLQFADPKIVSSEWYVDPARASRTRNAFVDPMSPRRLPPPPPLSAHKE